MNSKSFSEYIRLQKIQHKVSAGFTLVELLLVIGIIATLAVVVFVALDPAKRFADSRDARRQTDVETILAAISQFSIDYKGEFPVSINNDEERMIGSGSGGCGNNYSGGCNVENDVCVDLGPNLSRYLKSIPSDSLNGSPEATQYSILRDSNGIVTIRSCSAERTEISVSH